MSTSGLRRRRTTVALAAAGALALVAALPTQASGADKPAAPGKTQMNVQLLSFNDFHGNLEPPTGSSGVTTTGYTEGPLTDCGQAHPEPGRLAEDRRHPDQRPDRRRRLSRQQAASLRAGHPNSVTVAAGDLIGASPLISAAFHDEPTIEAMNALGLDVTSVGNHEFDEGYQRAAADAERRLHRRRRRREQPELAAPTARFAGANFHYLVGQRRSYDGHRQDDPAGRTRSRTSTAPKIGFIGMTLKDTPSIVTAAGVAGPAVHRRGGHRERARAGAASAGRQGDRRAAPPGRDPRDRQRSPAPAARSLNVTPPYDVHLRQGQLAERADSPIIPIAEHLDPQIDMIVSGHTHTPYVCNIPDPAGNSRLVTSASSFGRLVTETNLTYDRRTQDIVRDARSTSANLLVDRGDVAKAPGAERQLVAPVQDADRADRDQGRSASITALT